jgi:hypothetical protein
VSSASSHDIKSWRFPDDTHTGTGRWIVDYYVVLFNPGLLSCLLFCVNYLLSHTKLRPPKQLDQHGVASIFKGCKSSHKEDDDDGDDYEANV